MGEDRHEHMFGPDEHFCFSQPCFVFYSISRDTHTRLYTQTYTTHFQKHSSSFHVMLLCRHRDGKKGTRLAWRKKNPIQHPVSCISATITQWEKRTCLFVVFKWKKSDSRIDMIPNNNNNNKTDMSCTCNHQSSVYRMISYFDRW